MKKSEAFYYIKFYIPSIGNELKCVPKRNKTTNYLNKQWEEICP